MKKIFIVCLLVLLSASSFAQSISAVYATKQNPNEGLSPVKFHLVSTTSESLFYSPEVKGDIYESEDKNGYGLPSTFEIQVASKQNYLYKSFKKDAVSEVIADFNGNYYNINDSLHTMDWLITGEKKEISGYTCIKATTHFHGRNYEAWFTPQVPFSTGPWKLGGLPGLIFEAKEENGLVYFTLESLKLAEETVAIKQPAFKTEPITHKAYLKRYLDQMEEYYAFKEAQLRKSGSNIKISLDRNAFQPLEIYE